MRINFLDKLQIVRAVYRILWMFGSFKKSLSLLLRPLDAPRYIEFSYLQKFLQKHHIHNIRILDVSSPYIMAYILSKNNVVIKTDIDSSEKRFIKESENLSFKLEDATKLSFSNETFDFVYSVSVIEHIYEKYIIAIQEMLRVTKKGGHVYITFPVSLSFREEWARGEVYEKQHKENGKTFFQYRFDKKHVDLIVESIIHSGATVVHNDIFWERTNGAYDQLINAIKSQKKNKYINFLKNAIMNFWYGFFLFEENPSQTFVHATSCGNLHLILKKN